MMKRMSQPFRMCRYIAIMAVKTVWKRWDVAQHSWQAFRQEFVWQRAYLLVWWTAKVRHTCLLLHLIVHDRHKPIGIVPDYA